MDGPDWQLSLWPYRSLLRKDFVLFMGDDGGAGGAAADLAFWGRWLSGPCCRFSG